MLVPRRQDHAPDPGIDRQAGQCLARWRQLTCSLTLNLDGSQLLEQVITISDCSARRCLDKRKMLNVIQPERLHAQNHAGKRGSQDFGVRERRPLTKIHFVIEAYAYAWTKTAASTCTLIGRSLTDRLDAQLLDLVAPGIALDPG